MANAEERGSAKEATAWRRGMEERDALAVKENEKLRATAEKALADVKRSAAQSLKDVQAKTNVLQQSLFQTLFFLLLLIHTNMI